MANHFARAIVVLLSFVALAATPVMVRVFLLHHAERAEIERSQKTPGESVRNLLFDQEFGNFAIVSCVQFGDASLSEIEKQTDNFRDLTTLSTARIAEVLSLMESDKSFHALQTLYERRCDQILTNNAVTTFASRQLPFENCVTGRVIGAYALSKRGRLAHSNETDDFLAECIRGDSSSNRNMDWPRLRQSLACLTAAYYGSGDLVPVLISEVARIPSNNAPLEITEALAILHDPRAIIPLREILQNGKKNAAGYSYQEVYEWAPWYGPRTFRALILLGDYESIGTLISHVENKMPHEYWVLDCLRRLTRQDFGSDPMKWSEWWEASGADFDLPAASIEKLLKEAKDEKRDWLFNLGKPHVQISECFSSLD